MIKILYGVQGTGNGHITRARVMAKALNQRDDIEVDFLFSGRDPSKYFDMEVFGDYRTRTGLTFATKDGAISQLQTLKQSHPVKFIRDVRQLDVSGYDLLLNDFEPITAWAARRQKLPSISISHQAAFTHAVPKQGATFFDKTVMRYFAPTDIALGVHWYHFGHPIMPPFIEDQPDTEMTDNLFLVYLPFEELDDIEHMLEPLSEHNFACFHPNIEQDRQQGHIQWFKPSKSGFHQRLKRCQGVIANGGFELSSECLHLGKKLLIKPLNGQFEQLSNLLTLQQLGLCHPMHQLDTDIVEQWLHQPGQEAVQFPNDPSQLIDWLISKDWDNPQAICERLWRQVRFPEQVLQRLHRLG